MSDELKTCGAAGPNGAECDLEPHDFGMHRGWDQMGKRFDWGPHKPEFQHSPEPWNVVQTLGGDWYLTDCEDDYPVVVATPSLPEVASNARRVAARVNACQGIATELLESMALGRLAAAVTGWGSEHEKRVREALAAVQGMSVEQIRALKSKPPEGK